ncbi:killer cell lectin-like receptor subfamily F member 1 [Pantherophis guttatus]|uniref:Killer cell lectin-like receptor subfamily F member 1 n=1 Tax=Pantherophis guttatus TaxID=94885 RepID=A0ABM3ZA76_PANGU|nr:killer cell lectin-like receptor subfamily F member 1 [Pantherophis guttatus]
MGASGSRSPFGVWSHSSLQFFNQPPQKAKTRQRGPAFWSSSGKISLPQKQQVSMPRKKKYRLCPSPPKFLGITSWAQLLAIFLAAVALSLFFVLMSYLNTYIQKAETLNDQTLQMRTREKRLNDAIKLLAGDQGQHCILCRNHTWLQRAGTCYRRTDVLMPWGMCMEKCKSRGGSLLMADTEGEMEFLLRESRKWVTMVDHKHVPQKIWIGLSFNLSQKTWYWADGELMHIRIPIHIKMPCFPTECCVAISNGKAISNICSEEISCLCKKVVL